MKENFFFPISSTVLDNIRPHSQASFATLTGQRYPKVVSIHTSLLFVKLSFFFIHLLALYSFVSCVKLLFSHQFVRDLCGINSFIICFTDIFPNSLLIFCIHILSALYIYIIMYRCMYIYIYMCVKSVSLL